MVAVLDERDLAASSEAVTRNLLQSESFAALGAAEKISIVESICKRQFDLIRFADQKAQFLLRIALALFGVAFIGVPPAVMSLNRFLYEGGWKMLLFVGVLALYGLCAFLLMVAIMKLVAVVRPRMRTGGSFASHMLFTSIAASQPEEFRDQILHTDNSTLLEEMMGQAYNSAVIAQHKYTKLNEAVSWMLGGGLIGVAFALILLVSMGFLETPATAAL